jgi:hypothetical protein
MGSGVLIGSLLAANLIEEYLLISTRWWSAPDGACPSGRAGAASTCRQPHHVHRRGIASYQLTRPHVG